MNIIFDFHSSSGGAPKSTYEILKAYNNMGYNICAICNEKMDSYFYDKLVGTCDKVYVVKFQSFRNPLALYLNIFAYIKILKGSGADIIFSALPVNAFVIGFASRACGVTHVFCQPGGVLDSYLLDNVIFDKIIFFSVENYREYKNLRPSDKLLIENRIEFNLKSCRGKTKYDVSIIGNVKKLTYFPFVNLVNKIREQSDTLYGRSFCHAGSFIGGEGGRARLLVKSVIDEGIVDFRLLGHVDNLTELYNVSDVFIGRGRSVIEAAVNGQPSLVLCDDGLLAPIDRNSVEELALTNFTGRSYEGLKIGICGVFEWSESYMSDYGNSRGVVNFLMNRYSSKYLPEKLKFILDDQSESSPYVSFINIAFSPLLFIYKLLSIYLWRNR